MSHLFTYRTSQPPKNTPANSDTDLVCQTLETNRDDFEIYINGKNVAVFGSQGQQRSSIISLKLAEAEVVYDEIEEYPVLLLDDFMSELDKKRVKGFINNIKNNQELITTTEKIKLDTMMYNLYKVEKANVERID